MLGIVFINLIYLFKSWIIFLFFPYGDAILALIVSVLRTYDIPNFRSL